MKRIVTRLGCFLAVLTITCQLEAHVGGGIAVGPDGNIYCVHTKKSQVLRVSPEGKVTILASGVMGEGSNQVVNFHYPHHLSMTKEGNIYVADDSGEGIWKVNLKGDASYYWPPKLDWQTLNVGVLGDPFAVGSDNYIYSVNHQHTQGPDKAPEPQHAQIIKSSTTMRLEVLGGDYGHADGSKDQAQFGNLFKATLKIGPSGNLYVGEQYSVRVVTPKGEVSTLAGSAKSGFVDGSGKSARFGEITCIAVNKSNDVFVADARNHLIRKIDAKGNVTTVAGNGKRDFKDGEAKNASFFWPVGIAIDDKGTLYVMDMIASDSWGFRLRKIDTNGEVSTLATLPG